MEHKYFIIGTTSLNRPDLHRNVLPEWISWFTQITGYEIVWFINIDIISNLEHTYETTVDNYKTLIGDHPITQIFLKNPENRGNFLHACKRVSENIVKYIDDNNIDGNLVKIFWLEDDWKLNSQLAININHLIDSYSANLTHINLSYIRNNYMWALAPSILSYNLWKMIHYTAWLNQIEHIDPEHCVGLHYRKTIGNPDDMFNCTVINKNIDDSYFTQKCMNYKNSHYTYHSEIRLHINDKYIEKNNFISSANDKIYFVRITPSCCSDHGRQYMEKKKIEKLGFVDKDGNFYKSS